MHAGIEDLKMMIYLMNPKYYIPVKGEYRQLIANANIALSMGYKADNIVVMDNGQVCQLVDGVRQRNFDSVRTGDVMVDGKDSLDSSGMVLKDRELLSTDGAIIIGVVVNHSTDHWRTGCSEQRCHLSERCGLYCQTGRSTDGKDN